MLDCFVAPLLAMTSGWGEFYGIRSSQPEIQSQAVYEEPSERSRKLMKSAVFAGRRFAFAW
jgi:hypothetical protein